MTHYSLNAHELWPGNMFFMNDSEFGKIGAPGNYALCLWTVEDHVLVADDDGEMIVSGRAIGYVIDNVVRIVRLPDKGCRLCVLETEK